MTEPANSSGLVHPSSVPAMCLAALGRYLKHDAVNLKSGGEWLHIPGEAIIRRVRAVALGLSALGVKKGDRVALLSENRPDWSVVDLAILSLGAVNVPIYTTQAPEQVRYILEDSGARVLFVSGRKVYRHARPGIEGAAAIEKTIFFDGDNTAGGPENSMTLLALEQKGAEFDALEPEVFERALAGVGPADLATIIYTSGTTGEPKGVMLTHDSFVSNVMAVTSSLPISSTDVSLSVLPLSHIFERTCFYVFCWNGVSVYYAASFDQVGEFLREVRPTIMTAVPRLFEKVYHRILKKGTAAGGRREKLFLWALRVGQRYAELKDKGEQVPPLLEIQQEIASRLVFSKWREGVGGRLRYFVSGGAALSPVLSYAFLGAGINILQGYGMTETCIVAANRPDNNRVGTVGLPFPGIDVALDAEGEILVRGPNIMQGYYGNAEETSAVFTKDGWFKTGDVGTLDADGRLSITDRKKELFKLSNGKYVAPQLVESLIKQSALVSQVVVVGAGRKQPAALIVPDWEAVAAAIPPPQGQEYTSRASWSRNPAAVKLVQKEVSALTSTLADYERVRRVALLSEEFSIDGGELTPTLKVKRRVIDEKYGELIDELYGGGASASKEE
ncbi:MAG TPA: long-chain fatty acid--CoA ligase [Pyrinomonadaceae bacterium]|jgi:long-chain acyl-CoA synthetase|nr:long-chain fatty acid--CoA ligase [Pyrinomonadaceae bacterium]